ncbi:hypothetical protein BGX26_006694, partial [Mortierella sp. AD094]
TGKADKVETLGLRANIRRYGQEYTIPLLMASPDLEVLEFPRIEEDKAAEIAEKITRSCPKLRDINLEKLRYGCKDNHMVDLINTCQSSGLRLFIIHRDTVLRPKSVAALCSYTTTLETVKIPACGQESVDITLHLLRSCPNMRTIDAFTSGHPVDYLGRFTAKELLKEPWVCLRLEALSNSIVEVHNTDAAECPDGKYDHHIDLYSQIS